MVLKALSPSIEYDDGEFRGTLYLDHSTISTVASGYTTKSYTVSAVMRDIERSVIPPVLGNYTFENTPNPTIYVPTASVEAYRAQWSEYASQIVGYEF